MTATIPAFAKSFVEMEATSCVLLTYWVGRSVPFQYTLDVLMKLVPATVRAKSGLPTSFAVGLMLFVVDAGFPIVKF